MRTSSPAGVEQEAIDRAVDTLQSPYPERILRTFRAAVASSDDPAVQAGNVLRIIGELGLEVYSDYETGTITHQEMLEVVGMVTSYVFRRAVCRVPTNSLNKTFAGFSAAVRKDRYLDSVKAHFLNLRSYRAFPTDADFQAALQTSDLYNFRRRSYFLRMLENHGRKEHVTIEDYSIEHIMPQNENLSEEWQTALGADRQDIQHRLLHTLGNLTLPGYNSEYSDHAFAKKRDMEGGFRDSPLRLNKGLGTLETWTAEEIEARAGRLSTEALAVWPRPALSDDVLAEFQAQGPDAGFSIEDHPNLLAPPRRALFEKFSTEVLALDPGVTRHFLKLYVAFKAETNFVDIVPQKARMRLSLNIPVEALHDERALAWDVSGKGHWGNAARPRSGSPKTTTSPTSWAWYGRRSSTRWAATDLVRGLGSATACNPYQPTDLNLQNAGVRPAFDPAADPNERVPGGPRLLTPAERERLDRTVAAAS